MTDVLPKIIAVVGPTAAGKTSLGIAIAKHVDGEVISVDSRQVYKEMDIGTAKVEGEWKRVETDGGIEQLFQDHKALFVDGVPHWGIDLVVPNEPFSVADVQAYAEQKIDAILARGRVPILVGGTGFWIKAVIDRLNLAQAAPDEALREDLAQRSVMELFKKYQELDPEGAKGIDTENKRKLVRALEVTMTTGEPFSGRQKTLPSKYNVTQIGVEVPRDALYERINERVDAMIACGLIDEVRALRDKYGCDTEAMTGIGYRQICQFLEGEIDLKEAIRIIKRDTRHYAKRQLTWFGGDERINWVESEERAKRVVDAFLA